MKFKNPKYLLQENKDLKKMVKKHHNSADPILKEENLKLKSALEDANLQITILKSKLKSMNEKEETPHDILQDAAEFDSELTELLMRNDSSLQQIRHEINKTKRELKMEESLTRNRTTLPRPSTARI